MINIISAFLAMTIPFLGHGALIEGGKLSSRELMEETSTVALIYNYEGSSITGCTGVRIGPRIILTARHCLDTYTLPIGVRQSLDPLDETIPLEPIAGVKLPKDDLFLNINFGMSSNIEHEHDIALVILKNPSPKRLATLADPQTLNSLKSFIQIGYGQRSHDSFERGVPLAFLDTGYLSNLNETEIQIYNKHSSVRGGDSGGPLFARSEENGKLQLLGIANTGDAGEVEPDSIMTSMYVRVHPYLNWIRAAAQDDTILYWDGELPKQLKLESTPLINQNNYFEVLTPLCSRLKEKLGYNWKLNEKGYCFPEDENMCLSMANGFMGVYWDVRWNSASSSCVYDL